MSKPHALYLSSSSLPILRNPSHYSTYSYAIRASFLLASFCPSIPIHTHQEPSLLTLSHSSLHADPSAMHPRTHISENSHAQTLVVCADKRKAGHFIGEVRKSSCFPLVFLSHLAQSGTTLLCLSGFFSDIDQGNILYRAVHQLL